MTHKPFIKKYSVQGLFGYKNIELTFDKNVKILIGENGYGKTTILNSLAYLLQSAYIKLSRIKFEKIKIEFDDTHIYEFSYSDLKSYNAYKDRLRTNEDSIFNYIHNNIDHEVVLKLIKLVDTDAREFNKLIKSNTILDGLPSHMVYQMFLEQSNVQNKYKVFDDLSTYINSTGYKILFYPTYRRIEVDWKNIIDNTTLNHRRTARLEHPEDLLKNNSIIKFGMTDVEKRIDKICNEISESSLSGFAAVSGNMISKLLAPNCNVVENHSFDINEITIVLSRVGENMSQADKDIILSQISQDPSLSNQNQYLIYFLDQLLSVYKKQEQYDLSIKKFVQTCNKYLSNKEFTYDESMVSLKLQRTTSFGNGERIELKQLSSGEKQIVSIFSQLYLEPDKKYIVLFDEPELSLSIYWQEKLLPDILQSNKCSFLLAVTHSPFIFNNELQDSTVGIQEFIYE